MSLAKVSLLEMILAQEREVDRIESWRRVFAAEGKKLDPDKERVQTVARRTMEILELVREHQEPFVAMIKARREAAARLRQREASEPEPEKVARRG